MDGLLLIQLTGRCSNCPWHAATSGSISWFHLTDSTLFRADKRTAGQCPDSFDDQSIGTQYRCAGDKYPDPFQQCGSRVAGYARRPTPKRSRWRARPHVQLYATPDYRTTVLRPRVEHSLLTE